jgi:signal transduction histidine kinase
MDPKNNRIYRFAFWLIQLRWLGVLCIILITFISSRLLEISVREISLYILSACFLFLNILFYFWLRRILQRRDYDPAPWLRILTNTQIFADFLALTVMLHFSGGVENPFIIYYIFHMIMASIVLVPRESFIQVTLALLMVGILSLFEYSGILPHYALEGFVSHNLYQSEKYLLATGIIFISTSYMVVYITTTIVKQSRRHEESYTKANKELQIKDEIKNEYVLRITHDIKGHLAAIQGSLNVLHKKSNGSFNQEFMEFLETASQRTSVLIRFVKNLLYLTKLKLSNEFVTASFSVRESLKKVVASLEPEAREKSIQISLEIDETVNQITGFKISIEELIANLLGNAIKYSEQKSQVEVRAKQVRDQVLVEILDKGPGIPSGEIKLVFEEFYRGSNIQRDSEGTGLGLAIANKIVRTHGGRLWVESIEGEGSKFCFTLPL